jgi:hypothetical protein
MANPKNGKINTGKALRALSHRRVGTEVQAKAVRAVRVGEGATEMIGMGMVAMMMWDGDILGVRAQGIKSDARWGKGVGLGRRRENIGYGVWSWSSGLNDFCLRYRVHLFMKYTLSPSKPQIISMYNS